MSAVRFCLRAPLSQSRHTVSTPERRPVHSVSGHHFLQSRHTVPTPERRPDRFCLRAPLSSKPPHGADPGTPAGSILSPGTTFFKAATRCRPRNAGRIDSVSGHHFLQSRHTVPTPERRPDRFCLWAPLSQCRHRCRPRNAGRIDSVSGHHFLNAATGVDPGTPAGSILSLGTTFSMPPQVSTPERAIRSLARILHYIKLQRELYDDQGTRW